MQPDRCGPPIRALICEDEALALLSIEDSLAAQGYEVVGQATDGEDAVRQALRLRPDLVFMDVKMPLMDGIEALKRIMNEAPTAVVMLTAYSDPPLVQEAIEAGAAGYLVKPVQGDQLSAAATAALSRYRRQYFAGEPSPASLSPEGDEAPAGGPERRVRDAEVLAQHLQRRLDEERDAARILAESLLIKPPALAGYQIATRYEPAREAALVGGDYYDFIELPGDRLGLVIGDACGKGPPATAYMAKVRHMLRAYALEDPDPARVLARLNSALCAVTEENPSFITVVYGVLDPAVGRLTYCSAGHPPPILYHPATQACRSLPATAPLIGALPDLVFQQETVALPEGAALVLFTDGVMEARNEHETLGPEGICAALLEAAGDNADRLASRVVERAREFGGGRFSDDVAVVVLLLEEGALSSLPPSGQGKPDGPEQPPPALPGVTGPSREPYSPEARAALFHPDLPNEMEKAEALGEMKRATGASWAEIARTVGLSDFYVRRLAGLLTLTEPVKQLLRERKISLRVAIALRPFPPDQQVRLAERAAAEGLTAEQIRALREQDDPGSP